MKLEDRFQSLERADIDTYVQTGKEEDLYLEFKTVVDADLSRREDKKNLAKALSGFANSSGGILVWGVEAKKNVDGVDCARAKKEIESLSLFISRLNELTGDAVSPIVEGVEHRPIYSNTTKGYAITLVPESISGPHMAKLGEDRYYKRSGDSFYRMEHFDLEDMFGRRKRPHLILSTRTMTSKERTTIYLGIENRGRGSARAPYLAFAIPESVRVSRFGIDGNLGEGLPRLVTGLGDPIHRYGANSTFVLHPGTVQEIAKLESNLLKGSIEIRYEITAEDLQITKSSISIDIDRQDPGES